MPGKESHYPADWFAQGEKDLGRVTRRLAEGDLPDAAFHLQQALEKYLKGYLLSKGWHLRRTHNLQVLLEEAITWKPHLEPFRAACQEITAYYFADRYPFFGGAAPGPEDIKAALAEGQALVEALTAE